MIGTIGALLLMWVSSLLIGVTYHRSAVARLYEREPAQDALSERADILAWLRRRRHNHDLVATNPTGSEERAAWLRREMDIAICDLSAGLHEGLAAIAPDGNGERG